MLQGNFINQFDKLPNIRISGIYMIKSISKPDKFYIGSALKGKPISPERRANISKGLKRYFSNKNKIEYNVAD